jgi:hypothetical protein
LSLSMQLYEYEPHNNIDRHHIKQTTNENIEHPLIESVSQYLTAYSLTLSSTT